MFILVIMDVTFCTDMAPFYEQLCEDLGWMVDRPLLDSMKQANDAKLKELDEQIADAEKNQGEMEVRDFMLKKAEYYSNIGDKVVVRMCLSFVCGRF